MLEELAAAAGKAAQKAALNAGLDPKEAAEAAAARLIKHLYCKCVLLELGRISSWDINQQINALRK